MPWEATALVLVAAVLHAAWNLVAKTADAVHFALICAIVLAIGWAPVGVWALAHAEVDGWGWAAIAASAVAHVFYFQTLLRGYREADLSVVYPVARGTGPLLASCVAIALFAERPGWVGTFGLLSIPAGVFLLAGGAQGLRSVRVGAGVWWGAWTGGWIAAYTVVDGYAVKTLLLSPIVIDYAGNLLRVPLLAPAALADRARFLDEARRVWRQAVVVAVLGPVAYWLVLYAMRMAPVSRVAPLRETSMLIAAALGGRLLGEGQVATRVAGASLVAVGAVALAW